MSDLLAALIQGIVEGLTEFLPVSSTAHIIITQELLQLKRTESFWKMFAVVIQLGAIIAVAVYYHKRLLGFVVSFANELTGKPQSEVESKRNAASTDQGSVPQRPWYYHPLMLVGVSFVVTAIPCYLIDEIIGEHLESLTVIGCALLIGGIVMYIIDSMASTWERTRRIEDMTFTQAIAIGAAQILSAAFPGTSRSMSTIAGGQLMGLSRSAALEFSFFLSIPVMFAAAGLKLVQFMFKEGFAMGTDQIFTLSVGFISSFVVAILVIAWFIKWVRTQGFAIFAFYRVVLGIAVLIWVWMH